MTAQNMQLLQHRPDGVLYSDPNKASASCRFKTTSSSKTIDGIKVDNFVHEIIYLDQNVIDVGKESATDSLSVRVKISGSQLSRTRTHAIIAQLALQLPVWMAENTDLGFEPTTPPKNPVATP